MQLFRNQARTAKNADADRTADTDRETEADAENASKVTGLLGHHSSGQRKPTARRSQSKPILTPRCPRTVPLADLVWRNNHLHRHRDKVISAFLPTFIISPSRNSGISLLDCTVPRRVLLRVTLLSSRHLLNAAAVASLSNSAAFSTSMAAASSACSESDISSDTRGQITATTSASRVTSGEIKYWTVVSNIASKAMPLFSTASRMSPSRTALWASIHSAGAPTTAATKNSSSPVRPPESALSKDQPA